MYSHGVGIAVVAGLADEAAATLALRNDVAQVDKDEAIPREPAERTPQLVPGDELASPTEPWNAEWLGVQWNLFAIHAPEAWAKGRLGSPAVTVAILDSGIDYSWPDLVGRVDLARSKSFVPWEDDLVDEHFPGRPPWTDLDAHGTFVANIVASNSYWLAGVTTQTNLMAVKVCDALTHYCRHSATIPGFLYAVDSGADVANMSLGGGFLKVAAGRWVSYWNRLFNYAHIAGMTVVVAAGNDSLNLDRLPAIDKTYCSQPNTICVSATGPTQGDIFEGPWTGPDWDSFSFYSNYGRSKISVAAPGGNLNADLTQGGLIWGPCSRTSLTYPECQTSPYFMLWSGTSFATPHVAGLAALVVEDVGRNPSLVKNRIQQGGDDLGQPGMDPYYGHGRINVDATVLPQQ